MRVGVDLDGVVFNYVDEMRRWFGLSEEEAPDPFKWEIWECWGMSKEEFYVEANNAYDSHLFFRGKAYPHAIEGLRVLNDLGHKVYYITARSHPVGQRDTIAWLEEHKVPGASLTFNGDKTCVPVDVMIEDNLENAEALQAAGVHAFLMDRPWNQGDTEVPRVFEWCDFVAEVEHLAANDHVKVENGHGNGEMFRVFESGATRDLDDSKLDFEGFLSPLVLQRFAAYMHENRRMADGSLRTSDNWQRGIPRDAYMKSMWRHFHDVWSLHRGLPADVPMDEALCAVLFNAMGLLFEELRDQAQ